MTETDLPPLIPQIELGKVEKKIVRRVRRRDERLHNEAIRKKLQEHHEAYLEAVKQQHLDMLANIEKPIVYEIEVNDTGGLIQLPLGGAVIIQDHYYCRYTDPVTGMERIFGLSPEELEHYYEDDNETPPS